MNAINQMSGETGNWVVGRISRGVAHIAMKRCVRDQGQSLMSNAQRETLVSYVGDYQKLKLAKKSIVVRISN